MHSGTGLLAASCPLIDSIMSIRYNIGLKCKYAKILLNTVSICKTIHRNAILNKKNINAVYFYDIVWRDFAR